MNAVLSGSESWVEVGKVDDIPELGSRVVRRDDGDIAVFRNADNEVFALLNRCPHKGGPLSEGIVYGQTVTCPLHNWCIGLNNGEAIAPDEGCVPRYPVKVESGTVYLSLQPINK
jgi:nitrite reductase (NADH) small subunit